jgi:hypothetical protein
VRLLCPGAFCAAVAIAGGGRTEPVRVRVDAADAAADVHAWAASPHQCFQRVTALAARAAAHFLRAAAARQLLGGGSGAADAAAAAADPAAAAGKGGSGGSGSGGGGAAGLDALECLLLWLSTYSDLFSRPCHATGKLLCWEPGSAVPLPPVVRPFKLSRRQLAAAAGDPSLREAFHVHTAPRGMLAPLQGGRARGGAAAAEGDADEMDQLLLAW